MQRLYENYSSIEQMTDRLLQSDNKKTKHSSESDLSFREILSSTQEKSTSSAVTGLKFSKHANARLATRNINLSDQQMERLENGTTKAREKGIQESLIMVDSRKTCEFLFPVPSLFHFLSVPSAGLKD